ncbi:MAG: CcmD family protein [Ignavibacteria bacterium]|nr:CcmD family protein [Ignavibacteria bacterium]
MDSLYNFLNTHAYYGLLAIILIIWAGIFLYVQNIRKKVTQLQKNSSRD